MLSIVIPVYNVEQFLSQCLDSIVKQTYKDYEVIIVNDGSTDKSLSIINKYVKKHNNFKVYTKKNGGLSSARNYGLKYVKGEYLTFLDSDDYIQTNTYELMMDNITNNNNDIVLADIQFFNEETNTYILKGLNTTISTDINKQALLSPMFAWNKIYRTSYFIGEKVLYPKGLWYEDIPVTTQLFAHTTAIGYVDKPLYNYRQRLTSIMGQTTDKVYDIFIILSNVKDNFIKLNIYNTYKTEIEYLFIEHIMLYGQIRFIRTNNYKDLYLHSINYMNTNYPKYKDNKYIKQLSIKNKIFIYTLNEYTLGIYRKYLVGRNI